MQHGRHLGAWLAIASLAVLPMCGVTEENARGPAGSGEAGADSVVVQPSTGGSHAPTPQGGAVAGELLGGNAGTPEANAAGVGGSEAPIETAGTGGLSGDDQPHRCSADDDGISCCKVGDVSCDTLPSNWCSYGEGGSNPGPVAESCCDGGQRKVCAVVQGETGMEAYLGQQSCTCAAQSCGCER